MRPLGTNRRILTWLCLHPVDNETSVRMRVIYVLIAITFMSSWFAGFIASAVFLWKFVSVDFQTALHDFWQILGFLCAFYTFLPMLLSRQKIKWTFETLTDIYKAIENEDSYHYLAQKRTTCEWMWKIYTKLIMFTIHISFVTISGVSVVFCYNKYGSFDANQVFHILHLCLPWNQDTAIGYFGETCFVLVQVYTCMISTGSIWLLFFSICLHHRAYSQIFHHSFQKLNCQNRSRDNTKLLCNLIRIHILVKEWFLKTAHLFSPSVLIQLLGYMLISATVVYEFDQQSKTQLSFNVFILFLVVFNTTMIIFVYCYFGKIATESYLTMADSVYGINWHELPVRHQKYVMIMIQNMQRPLYYHGFGLVILNLETFTKFMKSVYNYYMIFKTISMK